MPGNDKIKPAQNKAIKELVGLVGRERVGGRTLCCLVGSPGSGKTWLANYMLSQPEFGEARYVSVNDLILQIIERDSQFVEIFDFNAMNLNIDLKRYGSRLKKAVHDLVTEQFLPEGLTILDHLELVFALGIDPVTTWYSDAVGRKRILLMLTGRMSGQLCRAVYPHSW